MNSFLPREKLYIPQLNLSATVVAVLIDGDGISYKVRYFNDFSPVECWLFDFEVSEISEKV